MNVRHNTNDQEFTVQLEGHRGELTYALPKEGLVDFQHTWVDEALRGRGVADALAEAGLAWARKEGLKARTTCKFMAAYVTRHPEWDDLRERQRAQE